MRPGATALVPLCLLLAAGPTPVVVPAPVVVLAPVVAPAPVVVPAPVVNDQVARGEHGAVVSAERHATAVGLKILRQGGNAVDAAVAVALALSVTHPQAGNLGGGGFMVIRMADGRTAALDFRERAPSKAHPDMYLRKDGTVDPQRSLVGATAAGVPGSPAGLVLALEKFGSKRLKELAAPAVELAADGFVVDHFLA
ncbi:MAG: gamma-glutamyltransferase, partial [Planctomycetota bacterium]